jgi:hypothetical protein
MAVDNSLQLVESVTPHDLEFSAAKFRALFEAVDDGSLSIASYSDANGDFRKLTEFSGSRCGQVVFDPLQQDE